MINFSKISSNINLGKYLRKLRFLIPQRFPLPIFQGILRGQWWIPESGVLGYLLGSYEIEVQNVIANHLKKGGIFLMSEPMLDFTLY